MAQKNLAEARLSVAKETLREVQRRSTSREDDLLIESTFQVDAPLLDMTAQVIRVWGDTNTSLVSQQLVSRKGRLRERSTD